VARPSGQRGGQPRRDAQPQPQPPSQPRSRGPRARAPQSPAPSYDTRSAAQVDPPGFGVPGSGPAGFGPAPEPLADQAPPRRRTRRPAVGGEPPAFGPAEAGFGPRGFEPAGFDDGFDRRAFERQPRGVERVDAEQRPAPRPRTRRAPSAARSGDVAAPPTAFAGPAADTAAPPAPAPRKARRPRSGPAAQFDPLSGATVEIVASDIIELSPSTSDGAHAGRGPGSAVDTRPDPGPGSSGTGPGPGGPGSSGPGRHGSGGGRHERPRRSFRVVGVFVLVIGAIAGAYLGLHGPSLPTSPAADTPASSAGPSTGPSVDAAKAKALADANAAALALAEQNRRATEVANRQQQETSRSGSRTDVPASCNSYTGNRALGCALLLEAGYGLDQMPCLDKLWTRESQWTTTSENKSSGAYGIPQALPGDKMAVYGSDWRTNAVPQIKWGLNYIKSRYGDPCTAWAHSQSTGWY
jgi:hypothetical protein